MEIFRVVMTHETNGQWPITSFHTTEKGAIEEATRVGYALGQQPPANMFSKVEKLIVTINIV